MRREPLPANLTRQVTPRALKTYATSLDWKPVEGINGNVAGFHRPDSRAHQVIVPEVTTLDDYEEAVAEAVRRLAEFERRPASEVLEHLLLPPADVLRFQEISTDAEAGTLPFEHAVRMINGTRRLLLSVARSVLAPKAYHPRLSRGKAEEFVNRCRLGQTERGSFVLNVVCPLETQLALPGVEDGPFTRRVTTLLMQSLDALTQAADTGRADDLLNPNRNPGISANFCESLLLLRPNGDRAMLTVSAAWSRVLRTESGASSSQVQLPQAAFEVAEVTAPRLRTASKPRLCQYVGVVESLNGQPSQDDIRPSGEVGFSLFDEQGDVVRARGVLNADDYATALETHRESGFIAFKAILRRLARMSCVENITDFERVQFESEEEPVEVGTTIK